MNPSNACFSNISINRMFNEARESLPYAAPYLFLTIDPCGGSQDPLHGVSDFALITHIVYRSANYICGLEAIAVQTQNDYESRVLGHIARCYQNIKLANAKLIVTVEGNLGLEASHVKRLISATYPAAVFLNHGKGTDGLRTDQHNKPAMAQILDYQLRAEGVHLIRELVCTDPNPAKVLEKLRTQLLVYSRLTIEPKVSENDPRLTMRD